MSTMHERGGRRPATSSGTDGRPRTGRGGARSRTVVVGGLALGLTGAALAAIPAQAINSNPPTGPGNIEVFPKRDMVAIEGYGEYAGKTAEITVTRNGAVIGSTRGVVDGTGFLEVNHPGGVCWGAGTDLKVTPDITSDDEINVEFLGTGTPNLYDGSVVQDVIITDVLPVENGSKLVISGTFGPDIDMPGTDTVADPGRFGVEIVNPDMRGGTSAVGERAIGWPVDAGEVTPGYVVSGGITSGAEGTGGTFDVTFDFELATDLDLALAGEVVGLAWMADGDPLAAVEAAYGNTLYEFHEAAGPGFGGCPAGPQEARASAPTVYTGQGVADGEIAVTWEAGTTLPQAPAITGYGVTAVRPYGDGADAGGVVRVGANARSLTVKGLTPGEVYDVEIASRTTSGDSVPAVMRVKAAGHVTPSAVARTAAPTNADGTTYSRPLVTNANVDFGVYLDPAEGMVSGYRLYYTTDGSTPSESSTPYTGAPIDIRTDTTVRWVIWDSGNIKGALGEQLFDIEAVNAPSAPEPPTAVPGDASATVTFPHVDGVDAYRVQAYNGTVKVGALLGVVPAEGTVAGAPLQRRVTGLANGTAYTFTLASRVGNAWSNESVPSGDVTPVAAPKANAGPDQTSLRNRVVTLDGTASVSAETYQWVQLRPADATGYRDPVLTLTGATTAKPTFRFPLKSTPTSDDGTFQFRLTTTSGGVTKTDLVDVKEQRDVVTATLARWRAGNPLRLEGTGSQEGARLTLRDANANGTVIATVVVSGGAWAAPGNVVNLSTGSIYVWSDHGFVGNIQTTR